MRELLFDLDHDPEQHPLSGRLAAAPDVTVRTHTCYTEMETLCRIDELMGPPDSLSAVEEVLLDPSMGNDCLAHERCPNEQEYEVVGRDDHRRFVYTRWDPPTTCETVPHLAEQFLGRGLVFEATRNGARETWRIVMPSDSKVGRLYDALDAVTPDVVGLRFDHLGEASLLPTRHFDRRQLPAEQRRALEAALEHGYYETPRECSLDDIASTLDIPRSTLSYRLRRAEAQLAAWYAEPTHRTGWTTERRSSRGTRGRS